MIRFFQLRTEIKLYFDTKPERDIKSILKSNSFFCVGFDYVCIQMDFPKLSR